MGFRLVATIIISMHLISCQTNEAVSMEKKPPAKTTAKTYGAKVVPILERVIGQHTHEESSSIFQHCRIAEHQVDDLKLVHSLIATAQTEEQQEALHIVAVIPSLSYFAYDGVKPILLRDSYSTTTFRDGPASKELMKMIDGYCKVEVVE